MMSLTIKQKDTIPMQLDFRVEIEYFIYEDSLGRKWKLKPVLNPDIKLPFIIEPIFP